MKSRQRSNALLLELLIVVMFFMLAASVLLRVFATARSQSVRAERITLAANAAQNLADSLYAARDPEDCLRQAGFTREQDLWVLPGEDFDLRVTATEEAYPAGVWRRQQITALWQEDLLLTLPCARYAEVTP